MPACSKEMSGLRCLPALPTGVVLSDHGQGVFVSYEGRLFNFSGEGQIVSLGYGGSTAVAVPGTGGLGIAVSAPHG